LIGQSRENPGVTLLSRSLQITTIHSGLAIIMPLTGVRAKIKTRAKKIARLIFSRVSTVFSCRACSEHGILTKPTAPAKHPHPLKLHQSLSSLVIFRTVPLDSYSKVTRSFYSYRLYRHFRTFSHRARTCTPLPVITVRRLDCFTHSNLFCLIVLVVRRL